MAITKALEAMPDGWSGTVYSDSEVALGRVFLGWRTKGLLACVAKRSAAAYARMGQIEAVLVKGHPTKEDLERGYNQDGKLVSEHNQWCDDECNRQKTAFILGSQLAACAKLNGVTA